MALAEWFWVPNQIWVGQDLGREGGAIIFDRAWPLGILLILPFSFFIGFLLAGIAKEYYSTYYSAQVTTETKPIETESS